jgi:hypothetical protein
MAAKCWGCDRWQQSSEITVTIGHLVLTSTGVTSPGPLRELGPATRWSLIAGLSPVDLEPPPPAAFTQETDAIINEGLAPIAVRGLTGRKDYTRQQFFQPLLSTAFQADIRAMTIDVTGSKVLEALAKQGIRAAVVKGPAASDFHPIGWPRPYADLDIIITARDFAASIACAQRLGFSSSGRAAPQRPWFDTYCREGINLHSPSGGNVDFHHHVPPWSLGSGLAAKDILARSQAKQLCGRSIFVASPGDLLVVSGLHVLNDLWKGKRGLPSWRDVIAITQVVGVDPAYSAFARAGIPWVFDLLISELKRELPELALEPVRQSQTIPLIPRMRLSLSGWSGDSPATRHRLAWAARLPAIHAAAFLVGSAVPSLKYVRARHGTYRSYWRRALSETMATAHGSDFRMTLVDDEPADPVCRTTWNEPGQEVADR